MNNNSIKILVVDDSIIARGAIKNILKPYYQIFEAVDGSEVSEKIESVQPDLIILDILMPKVNGYEVLEMLGSKGISIPVIVYSADIQAKTKERVMKLGADDFLNKPPNKLDLLTAIDKALAKNAKD